MIVIYLNLWLVYLDKGPSFFWLPACPVDRKSPQQSPMKTWMQ